LTSVGLYLGNDTEGMRYGRVQPFRVSVDTSETTQKQRTY